MPRVGRLYGHSFFALLRGARIVDLGFYEAESLESCATRMARRSSAVSPHPVLAESIRARGNPGSTVHEVAIASGKRVIDAFPNDLNEAVTATVDPTLRAAGATVETLVRTMTFGEFVDSGVTSVWGDEPIELLKVDIEAAEIPLLLDTPAPILQRFHQITVEFHDFRDDPASARRGALVAEASRSGVPRELRFTFEQRRRSLRQREFFGVDDAPGASLCFVRYRIMRGCRAGSTGTRFGREPADRVPGPSKSG